MDHDKQMSRVRALLAQAEHPNTSPAEAEAFTARAMTLMTKYGIDAALLAAQPDGTREPVTTTRISVDAPYSVEKATLLASVARASRCRVVWHRAGRQVEAVTVFGFPIDLHRVEVLYTSLLIQATRDLVREPAPYYESTAAYRRTWLVGFASAISARLTAAEHRAQADAQATQTTGTRSVALVLADRTALVESTLAEAYPNLTSARRRTLSGSGTRAGYAAGRRADIGHSQVATGHRARIGGVR